MLIVCEGTTEVNYFKGLIEDLKLSTANINMPNIAQNTPDSIFREAKKLYEIEKNKNNAYDRVYCVFDKDGHSKYTQTKVEIKQKKDFYVAYSEPCFEYWLLLHYVNTTKPFTCFDELRRCRSFKKHFPDYDKVNQNIFKDMQDKIDTACKNVTNNPYTNVHELVKYLQQIKA